MNTNTVPESRRLNDATLSFGEKLARWRKRPALQLVTTVMLLLLLAVTVMTMRHHVTDWQLTFQQLVNTVADLWEYNRS